MQTVTIPDWNTSGLIPPLNTTDPTSAERSPYPVDIRELVTRYATNIQRIEILRGFLQYRAQFHAAGIVNGVQWIDGSFMEDIEQTENRPPNDIDIVTFFHVPAGSTQQNIATQAPLLLMDRRQVKTTYKVDGYIFTLNNTPEVLLEQSTYWYSMWSHKRSGVWKGYLQISLDPANDAVALQSLPLPTLGGQNAP